MVAATANADIDLTSSVHEWGRVGDVNSKYVFCSLGYVDSNPQPGASLRSE